MVEQKGITTYQKKIGSAALFALSILILVVSCPLKRLISNNSAAKTPIASKYNQINNKQYFSKFYSSNSTCSAAHKETFIFQADKFQLNHAGASNFTENIFISNGHYISTFLFGNKTEYCGTLPSDYASLPLFLQHRSLQI